MKDNKCKITTLIENRGDENGLYIGEHGLSLLIEFNNRKILFDTGQTGRYLENVKSMGVDIMNIDTIILSHGHYDHTGGLIKTLDMLANEKHKQDNEWANKNYVINLFVGEGFFNKKFKKIEDNNLKYNGNGFNLEDIKKYNILINTIDKELTQIGDDVFIIKNFNKSNKYETVNQKFLVEKDNKLEIDEFKEEIVLVLKTIKGLIVIVGCSHVGIINILNKVKNIFDLPIYMIIGGTHLVEANEERIRYTCESIKNFNIKKAALSHCTADAGMRAIKNIMGEDFTDNKTGTIIII